jgi:ribonucleoside-diphosphate reductase alpha chain
MTGPIHTYDQVFTASTKYFSGDELAAKVFTDKYALQNSDGKFFELTPSDMHRRLSREFARIEKKYPNPMSEDEIFGLLDHFRYIVPQGSPMSAIGNPHQVQSLSNCYVVENPYDSYAGILKTDQELAQISKRRGGVGVNISTLRPKGMLTANAAKTTDGIGVFMERFSNTIREVGQNGRRGALLIACSVHHPEVRTFINIKKDLKKVTGANISLQLSDEFMEAVKKREKYQLRWPVDSKTPQISEYVDAREIWNEIIAAAHGTAEPGILFWDTALKYTPADIYADVGYRSICCNPCAELILSKNDSCRLLLLNLLSYVVNPYAKDAFFDYRLFNTHAQKAQRLMDDMIDLEIEAIDRIIKKVKEDPEPKPIKAIELALWEDIREACLNGRRTGTGITGLGDCLAALGVKYGSKKSIDTTESIYRELAGGCYTSTCILAGERGTFPVFSFEKEKGHPFLQRIWDAFPETYRLYKKHGRRNIALTTTAPTGSVSTLTQTTSGIEPAYLLSYVRRKKINPSDHNARVDFVDQLGDKWQEFTVYHHGIQRWMDVTGKSDIEESPYYGATSNEVDWKASVKLQGAAQFWTCHAISKTCNLPSDVSVDVVKDVYMAAWEAGCKGFTVYRDGSRDGVLISREQKDKHGRPLELQSLMAPRRPAELKCDIKKAKVQGEAWTIFVGLFGDKPYEVFGGLSKYVDIPSKYKSGKIIKNGKVDGITTYNLIVGDGEDQMIIKDIANVFENANFGTFTRTISLALRHGTPVQYVVEQLQKDKHSDMTSFSKVMARVLKSYIQDGTKPSSDKTCPSCKKENSLVYQEGCLTCVVGGCGWSKC